MAFSAPSMVDEIAVYCVREWRMLIRHGTIPFVVIAIATLLIPRYFSQDGTTQDKAIGAALVAAQLLV